MGDIDVVVLGRAEAELLPAGLRATGAAWYVIVSPIGLPRTFFSGVRWYWTEDYEGQELFAVFGVGHPSRAGRPWALMTVTPGLLVDAVYFETDRRQLIAGLIALTIAGRIEC